MSTLMSHEVEISEKCSAKISKTDEKMNEKSESDIHDEYDLDRCSTWISEHHEFKSVCLQFPDEMLHDSTRVAAALKAENPEITFAVLGDTSYGECCVDEIASDHLVNTSTHEDGCKAEIGVIHFGHTCLSSCSESYSNRVLYVFTNSPMDVISLLKYSLSQYLDSDDTSTESRRKSFYIFYDVFHHHQVMRNGLSQTDFLADELTSIHMCHPAFRDSEKTFTRICGRNLPFDNLPLPHIDEIIYVGRKMNYLHLLSSTFAGRNKLLHVNTSTPKSQLIREVDNSREIMRRNYLIERVRDAKRIGILVGTLSVNQYGFIISTLRKVIAQSRRKSYTFVVGKLNVAKLANFPDIDAFVLVACPENSLLRSVDQKEFLQPIVTPYEVVKALMHQHSAFIDDFNLKLDFEEFITTVSKINSMEDRKSDCISDVSLITGKLRNQDITDEYVVSESEGETALIKFKDHAVMEYEKTLSGSAFLQTRTWKGVELKVGESEVRELTVGSRGIASSYDHEVS